MKTGHFKWDPSFALWPSKLCGMKNWNDVLFPLWECWLASLLCLTPASQLLGPLLLKNETVTALATSSFSRE